MRFYLLTILAILPILIESYEPQSWALHEAKGFQARFLELLEKGDFDRLSNRIGERFEYVVKHQNRVLLELNKQEYLDELRKHPYLFSSGRIVSARSPNFDVEFEIQPEHALGTHRVVMTPNTKKYGPKLVRYEKRIFL